MIHNEHLRKADELYEIRHDNNGNAIHVYIKDGDAIVFGTLNDFIQYTYFGKQVDRFYCQEEDLEFVYENKSYEFHKLKRVYDFATLNAIRIATNVELSEDERTDAWSYLIKKDLAYEINDFYSGQADEYINRGIINENGDIL